MKPLDAEMYRVLHQRIARALQKQALRTEAQRRGIFYPEHVATEVLKPYRQRVPREGIDPAGTRFGATFSACMKYRYLLWRIWDFTRPHATFCLMNCSKADEVNNDPTVSRCCERTARWDLDGYLDVGGVKVVNAFAWRETDSRKLPKLIAAGVDITGPENDRHILEACRGAAIVVCGWGLPGHKLLGRGPQLLAMMRDAGVVPHALKVNADGSPSHPLYLSYSIQPVPL